LIDLSLLSPSELQLTLTLPAHSLQQRSPAVIDDPTVREVYANKLISAQFDGGTVVITMGTHRTTPKRINDRADTSGMMPDVYVSARLALSPPAAVELINVLNGMMNAVNAAAAHAAATAATSSHSGAKPN
jgi:hypothetical protein